jgi:hypothetical protein
MAPATPERFNIEHNKNILTPTRECAILSHKAIDARLVRCEGIVYRFRSSWSGGGPIRTEVSMAATISPERRTM